MSSTRRFRRSVRSVALVAVGSLAFGVLPAIPAQADSHGTPFDHQAACEFAPEHDFNDSDSARLELVKDCLSNWDGSNGTPILQGTGGNANFGGTISRAQFAAVLVRVAEILGATIPAAPSSATFPDVPTTHAFFGNIEQAYAIELFYGTSQTDEDDVDGDGNTSEVLFNPAGNISYAQVVGTIRRLLEDTLDQDLPDDGEGTDSGLDCGVFNGDLEILEGRSLFGPESTLPADCIEAGLRGQIFDLVASVMTYAVAVGLVDSPFAPPTNVTLAVSPTTAATIQHDNVTGNATPADDRQYSVTGLDNAKKYRIELFKSTNVTDTDGVFTFADAESNGAGNNIADTGAVAADIVVVNGAAAAAPAQFISMVTPVNGGITFSVDGEQTEMLIPVVFEEGGATSTLDLDASNAPTDAFGVGGLTSFIAPEGAGGGASLSGAITGIDQTAGSFQQGAVSAQKNFFYDANDNFTIDSGSGAVPSTMAQFKAAASLGDTVTGVYGPDPDSVSTFNLVDLEPAGPTALTATINTSSKATLTWTAETSPTPDSQNVYRINDADGASCEANATLSSWTKIATVGATIATYVDETLSATTGYCWLVTTVSGTDESPITATASDGGVTGAVTETVKPTITDLRVVEGAGTPGVLNAADTLYFTFSEDMADALGTGNTTSFRITDGDSVFQFDCAVQTCTLMDTEAGGFTTNPNAVADDVLRVVLIDGGTFISGTNNNVDFVGSVATVTTVSNAFADQAGNLLDLAGSADKVVDVEA